MGYCGWASSAPLDRVYHDTEWGIPVNDDRHMFEHLTLECTLIYRHVGLSMIMIKIVPAGKKS